MAEEEVVIDLKEIFSVLLKKIHWIAICGLIALIGGFIVNWYVLKPIYRANAMIIVNTRDEQNVVVTNDQINSAKQLVNTYEVILKSDTVLDQIRISLANQGFIEKDSITSADLKEMITISQVNNTQVMRISAKNTNQNLALAIVNEIIQVAPDIIIRTVKAGSVEVVSAPKLESGPISPQKTKNLFICLAGGIAAAAIVIVLANYLDNTIKSDDDIRKKLGFKVLGVIPKIRESDIKPVQSNSQPANNQYSNQISQQQKGG